MGIDKINYTIVFPQPTIEPATEEIKSLMLTRIALNSKGHPNVFRETADRLSRNTFRSSSARCWHTDENSPGCFIVELAASSTPPFVAGVVVNYEKIPEYNHLYIEDKPANYLDRHLGTEWVEEACRRGGIVRAGLDIEVTFLEQLEPFTIARGDAGLLLHRSADIQDGEPLVRSFYRKFSLL